MIFMAPPGQMKHIENRQIKVRKDSGPGAESDPGRGADATRRSLLASHAPGWGDFGTMTGAGHARMNLTQHGRRQARSDRDNTGHDGGHGQ